ncbi:MAG: sugar phosphate isomerase/epimerase [Planctomycetes bacterium]|nr:sugar phosphate isomerase/epimerase [Planctomycetota bacterium]
MLPTLAQVCSLASPFETDVADYAAGQCRSLEVYLTKLEQYLDGHDASDVKRLLEEHEMAAPVASFQGGLLDSQGEAREQHWEHFAVRLDLCRQLSIGTLVVAADVAGPLTQQCLDRVTTSLAQAAQQAEQHGVRLALEFQASAAFCNNLQTAVAVVAETASPHLGICLDAFHFFTGPSKTEDLELLTGENLFHVQLCDLAGRPRELASDADRILPGDGDLPLAPLLARLRDINYTGCVSVELMNPQLFQIPARQFGEIAITALRKLL